MASVEVGVERVVLGARLLRQQPVHFRDPRIGLTGAVEDEILLGIVAAGNPGRTAIAAFERDVVPGIEVRIARMRDGMNAPFLRAGLHVVPGDEAAARRGVAAAGHALDERVIDDERAARVAPALGPIGDGMIPHHLPGLGIERDDVGVRGRDVQIVSIDRHVALGQLIGILREQLGRKVALVFPDQVAGGAVERLDLVAVVIEEQHAIVDDRRRLGGTRVHRPRPRRLEVLDVVLVDLIERAVAVAVIGAAPHQPVRRRRIAQHLVRDRLEIFRRLGGRRLLRQRTGNGCAEDRQSQN